MRHDVGNEVPEYFPPYGKSGGFRAYHKFLFSERQNLTAHQPCRARPPEQGKHCHHYVKFGYAVDVVGLKRDAHYHQHGKRRHAVENIHYSHYKLVHPLAEVARKSAQYNSYNRFQYYDDEAHGQRDSAAVHKPRKHVVTLVVRTQKVSNRRLEVVAGLGVSDDVNAFARFGDLYFGEVFFANAAGVVRSLFGPDKGQKRAQGAEERKHEQHDEYDKPRHTELRAEKPLHYQPSRA